MYYNQAQTVPINPLACVACGTTSIITAAPVFVAANRFSSTVSQLDANQKAITYGNNAGQAALQTRCQQLQAQPCFGKFKPTGT